MELLNKIFFEADTDKFIAEPDEKILEISIKLVKDWKLDLQDAKNGE